VAAPFVVAVMYMHLIAMFDVLLVEDDVLGFASENGTQLPPTHDRRLFVPSTRHDK
jgi:hypothetical protein